MTLRKTRAAAAALALLALSVGSIESRASDAAPDALFARMPQSESLLRFSISASQPTRIAFGDGRRIQSAVWEQNDADVKTDPAAGQIFVAPRREGDIVLFITTEDGETAALTLDARADAAPQNIVLERRGRPAKTSEAAETPNASDQPMLPPMPVSDYEAAMKTFLRAAALSRETPAVRRLPRCPAPSASVEGARKKLAALKPKTTSCWRANGFRATVLRLRNDSPAVVQLREPALIGPSILAIGLDRPILRLGETAELFLIEADDV